MDDRFESGAKDTGAKTIRLTRAELYALRMSQPRRRRRIFIWVSLLVAAALGGTLWHFQEFWLPYWQSATEAAPTESARSDGAATAAEATPDRFEEPDEMGFMSATVWDDPEFREGVRLFNQALDRFRRFELDPTKTDLVPEIDERARKAFGLFRARRGEAPPSVPLDAYASRSRRLLEDLSAAVRDATPPAAAATPSVAYDAEAIKDHPDFREGARLFNQALGMFNQYKADPQRTELLKPTEDLAQEAGEKFEALKRQVPAAAHAEIDRLLHQSYGLVSASRGEQLRTGTRSSESSAASTSRRGTTGPTRRPALPAYQQPP